MGSRFVPEPDDNDTEEPEAKGTNGWQVIAVLFLMAGLGAAFFGVGSFLVAKSAIHEILGALLGIASILCLLGASVISILASRKT